MFTKKVTDSDAFIEMPSATQALYFHLNQAADDDGFNNQIQVAMMKAHASVDDLKILLMKNFVIRFDSGVIVIKHWRMHNTLRKDRYTPTSFKDELAQLNIKENQAYTRVDSGCQVVAKLEPQVSIGKVSIDKDKDICGINPTDTPKTIDTTPQMRLDKSKKTLEKEKKLQSIPPTVGEITDYCHERSNKVDPQKFFDFYQSKGWMVGKNKMKDWRAAVRTWEKSNNTQTNTYQKPDKSNRTNFEQRDYNDDDFKDFFNNA